MGIVNEDYRLYLMTINIYIYLIQSNISGTILVFLTVFNLFVLFISWQVYTTDILRNVLSLMNARNIFWKKIFTCKQFCQLHFLM